MRTLAILPLALAAIACGSAPGDGSAIGSSIHRDTTIDRYGKEFHFTAPVDCSPFVVQRIVDTTSWVAEYDARMRDGGPTIAATYTLSPNDAHPIQVDLSLNDDPPFATIAIGDDDVQFLDAKRAAVLAIDRYLDAPAPRAAAPTTSFPARDDVNDALALARCLLPAQTQLGFVPGFFQNRRDTTASDGVTQHSADAPPILAGATWSGRATILEALERAVACATATGDAARPIAWSCWDETRFYRDEVAR